MVEGSPDRGAGQRKHRLFGLVMESAFPFASRLESGRGATDLVFTTSDRSPLDRRLGKPIYESPLLDEAGESMSRLYRLERGELLRFGDALDFYLGKGRIDCHLRDLRSAYLVEIRLLGPVLAYWLERLAICALHAAAVVVDGRAVAFLASHQGGKTSLAAAMMVDGAPLLTDDLLPLEARPEAIVARSGYPQMRLWPDQLAGFVDDWRGLEKVHPQLEKRRLPVGPGGFGAFHATAVPLGAVYLPDRQSALEGGGAIGFESVPPRQALIELLRNSFSPFIVEAVGLQPRRLDLLGRLARRLPIRRLSYPSGHQALGRIGRAVREDLKGL